MLRHCVVRSKNCVDTDLARRLQRTVVLCHTHTSVRTLSATTTKIQTQTSFAWSLRRATGRRCTLPSHTKPISRYQTTTATTDTTTSKKGESDAKTDIDNEEEARLLENVEEIVDVPSSALRDVIDTSKYTDPIPIPMPDLGTSNGNSPDRYSLVKEWFFKKGDIIQHEDVLCDIETPDFTFGMETDDEGITVMGDILVPVGQPVPEGTVLCYTLHESKGRPNQESDQHVIQRDDDDDDDDDKDDQGVTGQKSETEKNK